jgi:hypothetical protein
MAATTIDAVLTDLARDGATGSVKVGRNGTVYVTRGRISYAECTSTLGVEELLASSGRISANGVRTTKQTSAEQADGGDLLISKGVLTRGELEFCVLSATLDASFFLLDSVGSRFRFKDGDRHWLGTHWFFDVAGLFRECRRRRSRLDEVWPSADVDTRPVVPVPRIAGQHVMLTALQWELLFSADSTATPMELAKRLGRPAYATLVAVREMAAAGLLTLPGPPESETPPSSRTPPPPSSSPSAPRGLPKREERSRPRPGPGAEEPASSMPQMSGDPSDVNLLIRLRDALEAL